MKTKETILPHRKELVDKVIANLEKGTIPWHRGWSSDDCPTNTITNKEYRGINFLLLSLYEYSDNRWCTFMQAKEKGWQIKKGAKGSPLEVYKVIDKRTNKEISWSQIIIETAKMSKDEKEKFYKENIRSFLRTYTVFNAEQINGVPKRIIKELTAEQITQQSECAENIIANSESQIFYDGKGRNYYSMSSDTIHLCKKTSFDTMQDYYATALHEIGHSTGHADRLNRNMGLFGSKSYAKEELIAELASMFMQQDLGLTLSEQHITNHSAYIQSWIELLKDKPQELFDAVSSANKIVDYVLKRGLKS